MGRTIFIPALFLLVGTISSPGQIIDGKQIVRAELITVDEQLNKPFEVGLRFVLEPGWYLYWKNPGDAGLPVAVEWNLPPGFSAGEVLFPTPQKFVYDDLIAYGYKGELVLLAQIHPPVAFKGRPEIGASLDWLVCKESCVRGAANVTLQQKPAGDRSQEALDRFRRMLPRPEGEIDVRTSSVLLSSKGRGKSVAVTLQGFDAGRVSDFFPEPLDDVTIDYKSIRVANGMLTFEFIQHDPEHRLRELKGLLIAGGTGHEYTLQLESE